MTELRRQRCGCWYTVVDACREERKPVGMGVEPMDVAGDRCARARNLPSTYAIQCCSAGCAACQAAVSCGAEQNASGPRGKNSPVYRLSQVQAIHAMAPAIGSVQPRFADCAAVHVRLGQEHACPRSSKPPLLIWSTMEAKYWHTV